MINLSEKTNDLVNSYYENNGKKLKKMVDRVLVKIHHVEPDKDEFYSLANLIFCSVLQQYDESLDFDDFLFSCLLNKFKSELTKRNRKKRCVRTYSYERDINGYQSWVPTYEKPVSLDAQIQEDDTLTYMDKIADTVKTEDYDIDIMFDANASIFSEKMTEYLRRLSVLQKRVVWCLISGFEPREIEKYLHITNRQYMDCLHAIKAHRNVSILF